MSKTVWIMGICAFALAAGGTIVASLVPAYRASRLDPIEVLRAD